MFSRSFIETLTEIFSTLGKVPKRIPNYEKLFGRASTARVAPALLISNTHPPQTSPHFQFFQPINLLKIVNRFFKGGATLLPGMSPAHMSSMDFNVPSPLRTYFHFHKEK